jgi:RNA polymerase sigma factor (sigma-70 family)
MEMTGSPLEESGPPQVTDAQLVRGVKGGRKECFDQLVLRYQRMVYAITRRMTSNHHDADDLAQETFLAAYRAMDRFDEQKSFPAYLSRIAINLSINHLRRRKRRLRVLSPGSGEAQGGLTMARTGDLHKILEHKELMSRLEMAMETLPAHQKAVLILKVYQELSYQEIANALGISLGTVMSRLHRARKRLRAQLKGLL